MLRIIAYLLLVCFSGAMLPESSAAEKPNIVLIFVDDLGWQECGFTGSDFNETPHLDRLAKQGMVFTQAYAASGNCAPSRACLLSGQYTPRHGVYAVASTKRGPVELMRLLPIKNTSGLGPDEFTLPKAMKSAGYTTGMFGKWHLDGDQGSNPTDHFDVVKPSGNSWRDKVNGDPKGIFSITAAACEFIEENKDRPFFAYVPHFAIHTPLQSRPEVFAKFKHKKPGRLHNNPDVAACLAELDEGVGLLMKKLAELGLEEKTLVVFTSDNGGDKESQEPLRGRKGCYYEGGIREPMIVRWPGVASAGTTCDVPVINVDFYATFAAVAGAKLPTDPSTERISRRCLGEQRDLIARRYSGTFPAILMAPCPADAIRCFARGPSASFARAIGSCTSTTRSGNLTAAVRSSPRITPSNFTTSPRTPANTAIWQPSNRNGVTSWWTTSWPGSNGYQPRCQRIPIRVGIRMPGRTSLKRNRNRGLR